MKANEKIILSEKINASTEKVWKALTEVDEMRKWYFENIKDFKAEPGFQTQFNVQSDERNFLHKWKVLESVPNKMINYSWEYENYSGRSTSKFELLEENDKTKLILTIKVYEDFPADIPEFTWDSCEAGWKYFINNLKSHLENYTSS